MTERDWSHTDLSGEPRLLLGERKASKRIEVHRVDIHEELFNDMRSIAQAALAEVERRDAKSYSTFASKTADDYFDVDVSDIPKRRDARRREDDPEAFEIASALAMIAETDAASPMTAEQLRAADPSLYAIVFESQGDYIGFVRNSSPRRRIKPGLKYLQYGDTLKKMEPPDLAIDEYVDVIVAPDRCAVLSPDAFATLFGDVGIAFEKVPANVEAVSEALKGVLPLAGTSLTALQERCGRRVSDAKRLHHIVTERNDALSDLTAAELQTLLERRGLEASLQEREIVLTEDNVSEFLDLVEGRLFNDDLTGEERRADSYSPRKR